MRLIFMGSPHFAIPSLEQCILHYEVVAVVTQPDRRAGRGRKLTPPIVKQLALEHDIQVLQPKSLRDQELVSQLQSLAPELIVVAAYGQILPAAVLDLPSRGCLNVHASLLPRWRGAAPIQAAILHGDEETGVTIMKMDPGLDTGPILSQTIVAISTQTTAGQLSEELAEMGGRLLISTLEEYLSGRIEPRPQDDELATYAPMLRKSDGMLDFSKPANYLERQIRAFQPWPGSFLTWSNRRIAVLQAGVVESTGSVTIGQVIEHNGHPAVSTQAGLLQILEVQPAGKNPMSGTAFLRGAPDFIGSNLLQDDS